MGNLIFSYQGANQAVIRDIVNFIKFPISLAASREINLDKKISNSINKNFIHLLNLYTYIIFAFGILSIFFNTGMTQSEIRHGLHPYMFLYSHPTILATNMVLILAIYTAYEQTNGFKVPIFLTILNIVMTMRTKAFALIAVYIFIKIFNKKAVRYQALYWIGIISVVLISLRTKLETVLSWTGSGRLSLYQGAVDLIKKCFPFGSGFGTFASAVSGEFPSKVYSFIYIPEIKALGTIGDFDVLGDTGYPYYIGQFGVLGFIFSILLFMKIFSTTYGKNRGLGTLTILLYILIGLIAESLLINNGVEIGIVLATVAYTEYKKTKGMEK